MLRKSLLFLLSSLIWTTACSAQVSEPSHNEANGDAIASADTSQRSEEGTKIMWLGDSILAGRGANSRYLLWNKLRDAGYRNIDFVGNNTEKYYEGDFDDDNETYGGKKTHQVRDRAADAIAQHQPDIAIIHLGTNDRWEDPPDEATNTAQEIGQIIDRLRQHNPAVKVFVFKFTHVDRKWQRELAAAIDAMAAEKTTAQSPVRALDLITPWDANTDTYDGTHPNRSGQEKIADILFEAIAPSLGTPIAARERLRPREQPNLALNQPVTASSSWDGIFPSYKRDKFGPEGPGASFAAPTNATDGNLSTAWIASNPQGGHWLMVDLGESRRLTGSAIYWESAGEQYPYTIEVSEDGNNWQTVVDRTTEPPLAQTHIAQRDEFSATGRYVKVNEMNPNNPYWSNIKIGIRELKVFGTETETEM